MTAKVMIVDDSLTVRLVLRRTIGMTGVDVEIAKEAKNGREALDWLQENPVDVVFTDLNMPVMGGEELIEAMSALEELAGIPVVVISSDTSNARMQELQKLGVHEALGKPFTPEAIRDVLQGLQ